VLLWQAGAIFDERFTLVSSFYRLLDSDAKNAILAIFQLYKATQQDVKALLHLMHADGHQALTVATVLVWLTINVGAENLLVDGVIENFVQLCTHHLQNISKNYYERDWCKIMLQLANCKVFAKKMICHEPLIILILEKIQKNQDYLFQYVQILVALIPYVQGIRNTRSKENLLEKDKDVMRELMKLCVLDNTCVSHVVLYHRENSSKGTKVLFFEPKFLFECVQWLLQQYI
jgi:hypothetical protein